MRIVTLFPHLSGLRVQQACVTSDTLILIAAATCRTAACPMCPPPVPAHPQPLLAR